MRALLSQLPESPEEGLQIWSARLDAAAAEEIAELHELLDETERTRAKRFHFEGDRNCYIVARGLLRELVGSAVGISPSAVGFNYGAHGKPALADTGADRSSLRFNVSHAEGRAIFALAWDREVGIDLESSSRLGPNDEHLSALATRVLSAREFDLWQNIPDATARLDAFLRAWTRKEAYVKATGEGLFEGLRNVEVILDTAAPERSLIISRPSPASAHGWTLHDLPAPQGFFAAVAIARR